MMINPTRPRGNKDPFLLKSVAHTITIEKFIKLKQIKHYYLQHLSTV